MPIEPVRSDPPDLDAEPFTFPITFWKATGETDERGKRQFEEVTEDFQCRPFVNAGVLMGLDAMYGRSQSALGGAAIFDLFDAAFFPEARARWQLVRTSDEFYITSKAVSQVAVRLYEEYTNRPTRSPAGS